MNCATNRVDVLIIGAGPAGLMAANWLSRLGISFRIVDKRAVGVHNGQADGVQPRTCEIFDSFGIADELVREGYTPHAIVSWVPDVCGRPHRISTFATASTALPSVATRYDSCTLRQARVEQFLIDSIMQHSGVTVERAVLPEKLEIDQSLLEDDSAYPIRVTLRHLTEDQAAPKHSSTQVKQALIPNGLFRSNLPAFNINDVTQPATTDALATEDLHTKYVIGCDGAHSWVRCQADIKLEGESTDDIWGVVDARVLTDFPDARKVATIQSHDAGSVLWIPREQGLVRIYVQLRSVNIHNGGCKFDREKITPELIMRTGQGILHPYKVVSEEIGWWTTYQIGQRVANRFSLHDRVFLAGDAVHTHSPKAGQGMNVSMADSYNLGWKIGSVIRGLCHRSLLKTYELERRTVARDLIAFDRKLSHIFAAGSTAKEILQNTGIGNAELLEVYKKNRSFMTGFANCYQESIITAGCPFGDKREHECDVQGPTSTTSRGFPTNIHVGKLIGDYQLVRQSSDSKHHLQQLLPSDGRWRLLIFTGDLHEAKQADRLRHLCNQMNGPGSFLRRFTPTTGSIDAVIEVLAIHTGPTKDYFDFDWPDLLRFCRQGYGLDYNKVFADDVSCQTYQNYGVDPKEGCVVVVRPDQHVSWIGKIHEDYQRLDQFFSGFMRVQDIQHSGAIGLQQALASHDSMIIASAVL